MTDLGLTVLDALLIRLPNWALAGMQTAPKLVGEETNEPSNKKIFQKIKFTLWNTT